MTNIKNVIFDCSDTLLHFTAKDDLAEKIGDKERAYAIHNTIYSSQAWTLYDLGEISFEEMKNRAFVDLQEEDRSIAEEYLEERAEHYSLIEGISEILESLKKQGYKLYVISNFPDYFEVLWNRFPVFRLFDDRFVSYQHHASKGGDGRLFDIFLQETGSDPTQCVFIDDLDFLVENAVKRGITGIVFEGTEPLKSKLKDLNIEV